MLRAVHKKAEESPDRSRIAGLFGGQQESKSEGVL